MNREKCASHEVRQSFLEFFGRHEHEIVESAPLVPQNDPTLMFVNAGMVQFKDVFTGRESRPYTRACSSQKCIRISGKHNDLENVGATARHHTFFEMLGNFSFGDYFKEEAIALAWELLTKVYDIPVERMVVTVFEGDEEFPADDEAAELWRKIAGLPADKVIRLGRKDNFWSMGDVGPCGPCSEIHFFHGDGEPDLGRFDVEPAADGKGWTEIWNLVFMQYERAEPDGPATKLPAPCIDTGAGLERVTGVLQGVTSNYDIDIFAQLLGKASAIAGKTYRGSAADDDVSLRVIADHARTTAFLIAEGVLPDKQRREYVLRRVMRRAIRHGHRLGIERPFLHEVALEVVAAMGDAYPELVSRKELIAELTEGEESRFRNTLRRGMKIIDERFAELRAAGESRLPAETAADLYTTYGFPLDLTEVICREQGLGVDIPGAEAAIAGGAGEADGPIDPGAAVDPVSAAIATQAGRTEFIGYTTEQGEGRVVALIALEGDEAQPARRVVEAVSAGDLVEIVTTVTPFYAESGGQVGDAGTICGPAATVTVLDTQRPYGDTIFHRGRVETGQLAVGSPVQLAVDGEARQATRRNHSATHLLHYALRTVLGPHAQQKGSRVGPDVLRFDFTHNSPLTDEQIDRIEDLVNAKILTNSPVQTEVLPVAEARQRGAMAIFEEKYGDVVRMVTMTADSIELCGGTHARALGDIGLLKILSEGGTAAGVRRVFAATGANALAYVRSLQRDLARARAAAKAPSGDLADKIAKLMSQEKALQKRVAELERRLAEGGQSAGGMTAMLSQAQAINGLTVLGWRAPDGTQMPALRELAEKLRDKLGGDAVVLAGSVAGEKAQLALTVSKSATARVAAGALIKPIAQQVGGSGGGRPDMAQAGGNEPAGIDRAIAALYEQVLAQTSA